MQTSILIARLIGPLLVMTGLIMLVTSQAVQDMAREFLASRALIFIAGVLALLGGLAIVNTHNVWTAGWPVIITIFGWLAVIGGIVRMGFPALTKSVGEAMLARHAGLRVSAVIQLALGLYLMFVSYL
jgi:uncharacterized protein YjeT (DUF2065 family)